MFPLLQLDAAVSVAGAGLSYIGEQKLLINKDISVVGKIPVARYPASIFAGVAVKLGDMLIISGQS
jgi:hypothetical protein